MGKSKERVDAALEVVNSYMGLPAKTVFEHKEISKQRRVRNPRSKVARVSTVSMFDSGTGPAWAEISLSAITQNFKRIRDYVGGSRQVMAIVKANAYGLGAERISLALAKAGVTWFGVSCVGEGIMLRRAGVGGQILVLTDFWSGEVHDILKYQLVPTVSSISKLKQFECEAERFLASDAGERSSVPFPFHLKINTGMNRLGLEAGDIGQFARMLHRYSNVRLAGTYSHFAASENLDARYTDGQEACFRSSLGMLRSSGANPGMVHLANSGAICARPTSWADMVRPGTILYGYPPPLRAQKNVCATIVSDLKPSFALRSRVMLLREIEKGEPVGYGPEFIAPRRSKIAVVSAGFADGVPRSRSNAGSTIIRGAEAPIVGLVSMDLLTIDVTNIVGVSVGDVVTIYGRDGGSELSVARVAREMGTVVSELLCSVGMRVPRLYSEL